ncbi:M23 family metallopeptidase [Streptomyces peucetius]|uniref:Peptidoglycan DD-metalloendopeptidase family protein n=1 Tax=Streptomyces peucetius TaxID=1950 RepID=A0ABY6IAE0_STRPE|nr:peptidoglycan DD-metalloendopeptidase family protein [Streptomyces peucetius]UYQ63923.1 peptidoglycan DD-metalloendopeptidase family protein [Streptomyces peucetius]
MNDQHAHAGYGGYATGSFDSDPLFGALPGSREADHSGQYDASQWDTGAAPAVGYDAYAGSAQQAQQPPQDQGYEQQQYAQYDTTGQYDTSGQWDASAWNETGGTGQYETAAATFAHDATAQWAPGTFETGSYDATAWNSTTATPDGLVPQQFVPDQGFPQPAEYEPHESYGTYETNDAYDNSTYDNSTYDSSGYESGAYESAAFETEPAAEQPTGPEAAYAAEYEPADEGEQAEPQVTGTEDDSDHNALTRTMAAVPVVAATPVEPRPVRRAGGGRGRRRTPAKRSALLTVAVPSACVMGVAGVAAASVSGLGGETQDDKGNVAAPDPGSVEPVAANNAMDTQLAALSADARDFGDRASRTQERLDLKARQAAEKKKREEEAARREALRPKFMLPVKLHQLSAYYGQSGVNWMSLHTGIDFPVQYGTPVMAATDGTVRTQWNSAYGNMAIVTAADGTETWYCHLSSTKIRSGSVKAGDVIAYSGNSGNSTGPHLHFEVRPGGGAAIDPLPWLRSHGIDPT